MLTSYTSQRVFTDFLHLPILLYIILHLLTSPIIYLVLTHLYTSPSTPIHFHRHRYSVHYRGVHLFTSPSTSLHNTTTFHTFSRFPSYPYLPSTSLLVPTPPNTSLHISTPFIHLTPHVKKLMLPGGSPILDHTCSIRAISHTYNEMLAQLFTFMSCSIC